MVIDFCVAKAVHNNLSRSWCGTIHLAQTTTGSAMVKRKAISDLESLDAKHMGLNQSCLKLLHPKSLQNVEGG